MVSLRRLLPPLVVTAALLSACTAGLGGLGGADKLREPMMNTAREAYPLAERVARKWKQDAELRSIRTSWRNPTPAQLRAGKASWAYYFVSPSSKRDNKLAGYIVTVSEGEAQGVKEDQFAASAKSLIFVDWKVDSAQALKVFLENGGQDFLAGHAQADIHTILYTFEGTQSAVWEVSALDRETKAAMSLRVNATSGAAILSQ